MSFQPILFGNLISTDKGPAQYLYLDLGPGISLTQNATDFRRVTLSFSGSASSVYVDGVTIVGSGTQPAPFKVGLVPILSGGTGINTAPTLGQFLVGNSSGSYNYQKLNAGTNVTITYDASTGQPTINSTGGGGVTYTFDPAFFTNTNNTISLLDSGITNAKINSVDFSKITNVPYGTPQGIPRLDANSLVQLINLPSTSSTSKGVAQVDGTTITSSANTVISVSQDGIKTIVYNLINQILLVAGNITKTNDDVNKQITLTGSGSGPTPQAFDYSLTATWTDGSVSKAFYTSEASVSYSAVATNGSITGTISVVGVQNGSNIFTLATATGSPVITDFVDAITINASIQGTGTQGAGQITVSKSTQLTVFSPIFYFCGTQPANLQSMVSVGTPPQATNTVQVASGTVGGGIYFATKGTVTSIIEQGFEVTFVRVGAIIYTPGNVTYNLWQMTGTSYESPFSIILNIQ